WDRLQTCGRFWPSRPRESREECWLRRPQPSGRQRVSRWAGDGDRSPAWAFGSVFLHAPPRRLPLRLRSALRTAPARAEGRLQPGIECRRTEMWVELVDPFGVQVKRCVLISHSPTA